MNSVRTIAWIFSAILILISVEFCLAQKQPTSITSVEVFQVYELPVTVAAVELVKTERTYELRCSMTNVTDERLLGFRYSLVAVESNDVKRTLANRSEAFALAGYETKRRKIRTPLDIKLNSDSRLVLMVEQIVGAESIWEVVKPKDALDAYLSGDFSVVPRVLHVPNHVDVPTENRVPLRRQR